MRWLIFDDAMQRKAPFFWFFSCFLDFLIKTLRGLCTSARSFPLFVDFTFLSRKESFPMTVSG